MILTGTVNAAEVVNKYISPYVYRKPVLMPLLITEFNNPFDISWACHHELVDYKIVTDGNMGSVFLVSNQYTLAKDKLLIGVFRLFDDGTSHADQANKALDNIFRGYHD